MTEILRELIDMIREMSPLVWSSLVRQAYVSALSHISWAIVFSILGFITTKLAKGYANLYKEELKKVGTKEDRYGNLYDEDDINYNPRYTSISLYVLATIIFMLVVSLVNSSFARLVNPDFYAIQYILDTLK